MKKTKKILLTAINAKYIHSNPAIYSLRAYAKKYRDYVDIAEFTINHYVDDILQGIYRKQPDVVAFSCYIWNLDMVEQVIREEEFLTKENLVETAEKLELGIQAFLSQYQSMSGEALAQHKYERFRKM